MASQDAGKEKGRTGTAVGLEPGQQMQEQMVVEVGDDEVGGGDGFPQDVPLPKTDAFSQPVELQVSLCFLHGHGIAVPTFHPGSQPGGGKAKNARATAEIQDSAGFQAGAVLPHELDDIAKAEAGGGVLAGAEGRAGPDLEAGDSAKILGEKAGVAGDDQVITDPKMERGGFALVEFADAAFQAGLEFSQGQDFRGVDLQDSGLAGAFELGGGQFKFSLVSVRVSRTYIVEG